MTKISDEESEPQEEKSPDEEFDLAEALIDSDLEKLIGSKKQVDDDKKFPEELFIFPLTRRPFFPGMAAPLVIEPGPYYEVLKIIAKSQHKMLLALFLTKEEEADIYSLQFKDLCTVGVMANILRIVPLEQGGAQIVLNMEKRIKVEKSTSHSKYLKAKIIYHDDEITKQQSKIIKAYSISIITTIKELLKLNPLFKEELQIFLSHSDFTEPGKLADFAVSLTTAGREELQDILEAFDVQERIDKALVLLKKELDLSKLQSSINQKIEATISKTQREFFLREQLKTIKKELGLEKDDKTCDIEKFCERLKGKKVPEDVQKVINEEINKLRVLEVQSAEYSVSRNYIDYLTIIPWGVFSEENHDLEVAEKILHEDHYGLKDIKERILEFIGVGALTGRVKGSIICFVGPPGVGKTSIGKSIARALSREFFRFSVGGMRDEAEIKGHRRTYVGAMPGKIIQALKNTQKMNPVIMIDEVDKMGISFQGDPASSLLEVLDPEQNHTFLDHYLDVRCDLSNVLFILTANVLDTIPGALRDRMDVLRLSGYIKEEKIQIAKKYLIPRNRKNSGLKTSQVRFTLKGIQGIIEGYAREAGVRSLENNIKKILRKAAVAVVKSKRKGSQLSISEKTLEKYLGKPIFTTDRYYDQLPVGVCIGLAWTAQGGAILYVEAVETPAKKAQMKLTGQAGEVMQESAQIAWSFIESSMKKFAPKHKFFEGEVHLHIPEGATPKDGPSAGVTMATALLSLLIKQPVVEDLGMTGELTLMGKILPIGGLKEKLIAARRSKLKALIFPKDNKRDYDELSDYLKEGIQVYFVNSYNDIFKVAFPRRK